MQTEEFKAFVEYVKETNKALLQEYLDEGKTQEEFDSEVGNLEIFIYIEAPLQVDGSNYVMLELYPDQLVFLRDNPQTGFIMFKDEDNHVYTLNTNKIYHLATTEL